jgi:hypothetical protein
VCYGNNGLSSLSYDFKYNPSVLQNPPVVNSPFFVLKKIDNANMHHYFYDNMGFIKKHKIN